jgi:hypothetical protein
MDETMTWAESWFTVEYDKLCKNCPTLLQPQIDMLTEMIMGLSMEECHELLAAIAQCEATNEMGLRTPKEVYDFQLPAATGNVMVDDRFVANEQTIQEDKKQNMKQDVKMKENDEVIHDREQWLSKVRNKMGKARVKFMDNEMELAHAEQCLHVTTLLLAEGKDAEIPDHEQSSSFAKEFASSL